MDKDRKGRRSNGPHVASSRACLYAIARGKGGIKNVGLYREPWDRIELLVQGYSKGRFKKVKGPAEGMSFIREHCCAKGVNLPKWL